MKPPPDSIECRMQEDGFVLVGALLILLLLVLIGISASTSTILEIQIAAADRVRKETFYQADSGAQLAVRLVEENLGSFSNFTAPAGAKTSGVDVNNFLVDPFNPNNTTIFIANPSLAQNEVTPVPMPTDAARDLVYFPGGYDPTNATPHTNITVGGLTSTTEGAGLQMVAGYEGKGKGTAGGGGKIAYTINSQHVGRNQSESVVQVQWRHMIGLELDPRY